MAAKAKNVRKTPRKRTISPITGADITAHQFKPGNPGGGRPPGKSWATVISELLDGKVSAASLDRITAGLAGKGTNYRRAVVARTILRALGNNPAAAQRAAEFLAEREDGKATQPMTHSGNIILNVTPEESGF